MSEKRLVEQVAEYLQYKNVIYRFDLAADLKLNVGQAARHKKIHPTKGHPDLTIYKAMKGYNGLCIELKTEKANPYKKNGELKKNQHLENQHEYLQRLKGEGFYAVFCCGFDEVYRVLEWYLKPVHQFVAVSQH